MQATRRAPCGSVVRSGAAIVEAGSVGRTPTARQPATAIILAGGSSRRAGRDKSLLRIEGRPLIEHICRQLRPRFDQILVSANNTDDYAFLGVPIIPDRIPGSGPLMGIATALETSSTDLNFVVACDIPEIDLTFVERLLREAHDYDGVVPVDAEGRWEPLFAVYRKTMLEGMFRVLDSGRRRVSAAFPLCRMRYVELGADAAIVNLNTFDEYRDYVERRGRGGAPQARESDC